LTTAPLQPTFRPRPLRLWPGVVLVILQWLVRFALPVVAPETRLYAVLGGLAGGLLVLLWWLFFSRAPWLERLAVPGLWIVALFATPYLLHKSIATGAMGLMFAIYVIPVLSLALVAWAVLSRGLAAGPRWAMLVAAYVLACAPWMLLRTTGMSGDGIFDFAWRWSPTKEELLLAKLGDEVPTGVPPASHTATPAGETPTVEKDTEDEALDQTGEVAAEPEDTDGADMPATEDAAPEAATTEEAVDTVTAPPPEWPGFRGPHRDSVVSGVRIATDWTAWPPVELWRRPIGPGWSSFAVHGDLVYTQEQRGEEELVSCYHAASGEPVWQHRDAERFWESNAGAGPRATPTLENGHVYTFGATGVLNALDAHTGEAVWSRDVAADSGAKVPGWGFSSSPLVIGDVVIVAAAGRLVAYDVADGELRWTGPDGGISYSSPHRVAIGGVEQVLLASRSGVLSVAPADGAVLWKHEWPGGARIVQPAQTPDGDLLVSEGETRGLRRLSVHNGPGGWSLDETWTTNRLKPYFSDFVVHEGHAYGFDGAILACIDLANGERTWKGGRYGSGQLVLLPDQDLLLVISERGELALVSATPEGFEELARVPAVEGKTWNHPVLVDDLLLVRNASEMVAFRLARAK